MSTIHTRDLLCEIRFDRMMRSVGKKMGKIDVESERERKKQPDLVRFFLCVYVCCPVQFDSLIIIIMMMMTTMDG